LLCPGEDVITWKFGPKGRFTVKSVYDALLVNESGICHKKMWKSKIPSKIKIFLWLVMNNAILTKDNMIRRKWKGDPACYFCPHDESVNHLFFQCNVAKAVWAIIAKCIGADNIPRSFSQSWTWADRWLPSGKKFHAIGIVGVYWAIWKTCNKVCFEGKSIKAQLYAILVCS
jgi:hypothetical protein